MVIFKGKKGLTALTFVFLAFIVFGLIKLSTDDNIDGDIKDRILDGAENKPISFFLFTRTLDDLTPTVSYNLPKTERKIPLVNEFPLFSFSHVVIITFLFLIAGFIMRKAKATKWTMAGVFMLLFVFGYFISSGIIFLVYNLSAIRLGFTLQEASLIRRQFNSSFENVVLPMIIAGLVGVLSILKAIFGELKKAK